MAQVKAQLNNLRIAPRKVRAVARLIKGKNINEAFHQLEYFVRKSVGPIKKLLDSAIANAENNFNMVKDNLYIKEILVNEGIKLKRFRAKGFGRAASIQKKTSHIKIILEEHMPGLKREKIRAKKETSEETVKEEVNVRESKKPASGEARQGRPEIKREIGPKGMLGNIGRKIFQRKQV